MSATAAPATMAPAELARRLAAGEPITILDIRESAGWTVEGPAATARHEPARIVLADPAGLARRLHGPVVIVCNRGLTAIPVARELRAHGADALALDGGMRGWVGVLQDRPVDAGIEGLTVRQVQRPARGCLSYVLAAGGRALVVDPAPDAAFYVALAEELGAEIAAVFDTHLHADHLSGARELAERTGAALRMPEASLQRGLTFAHHVHPVADGDRLDVGAVEISAIALPGHTTDMTGLLVGDRALVAGDSLFADGIARPDLQRGDPEGAREMARTLFATLRDRVLALPGDVLLLPCHTHPGVRAGAVVTTLAGVRAAVPELGAPDAEAFADALLESMPPRPANYEAVIAVNAGFERFDAELESGGNSCATR